jgi:hypothetical protein
MRKAAAVVLVLASISAAAPGARAEGTAEPRVMPAPLSLFARAGSPDRPGFSLAESVPPSLLPEAPGLDLQEPGEPAAIESAPKVPAPGLVGEAASPHLSVSVFLGRGESDVFASLHKRYTWKVLGPSMTVGVGLYREIPVCQGVGLLPYVGVIRASATLRPSDLYGNHESFQYELTAFCVGLPLVIRFN